MKLCRHCNARFDDEHPRCVHCGRRLRAAPEATSAPGGTPAEPAAGAGTSYAPRDRGAPDVSKLHHLTDDHPAKIAPLLDRLEAAEVPATLVTDAGTHAVVGWLGSAGWEATASVYVDPEHRERAQALHREFLGELAPTLAERDAPAAAEDACPACGAPASPTAAECASCGLAFPDA